MRTLKSIFEFPFEISRDNCVGKDPHGGNSFISSSTGWAPHDDEIEVNEDLAESDFAWSRSTLTPSREGPWTSDPNVLVCRGTSCDEKERIDPSTEDCGWCIGMGEWDITSCLNGFVIGSLCDSMPPHPISNETPAECRTKHKQVLRICEKFGDFCVVCFLIE